MLEKIKNLQWHFQLASPGRYRSPRLRLRLVFRDKRDP